jgi:hypothetical protein
MLPAKAEETFPRKPRREIHVGSRRQLLCDDFFIDLGNPEYESYCYGVRWSVGRVEKSPNSAIFHADRPWEDSRYSPAWCCLLYDAGRFRLWYNARNNSEERWYVCYAESDDGLTWRKPLLNLIEKGGTKQNNVVYAGGPNGWTMELGNVFLDPSTKPEERYKMFYPAFEGKDDHGPFIPEAGVMRGAYSSDGLNWNRYPQVFLGRYCDSQNVATYDPVLGKYVAYVRSTGDKYGALDIGEYPVAPASRGRCVGRMESDCGFRGKVIAIPKVSRSGFRN